MPDVIDRGPLAQAYAIQQEAAALGFDWPEIDGVLAKVGEETAELVEAIESNDGEQIRREVGDLLFTAVNVSRFLGVPPWEALALANQRFTRRFTYMREAMEASGDRFDQCTLDELEALWQEAKQDC